MNKQSYDLEERLLEFSVRIIMIVEQLPNTRTANHVAGQLLRSGTAPYPNHGEAQAAESPNDFIHKLRISSKELRETQRWLKLIRRVPLIKKPEILDHILVPYSKVFCQKKQENLCMLRVQAFLPVIPAWFWPESRDAPDWIPAKGTPE